MTAEPFAEGVQVTISGELDLVRAYTFDARMKEIEAEGPDLVVLDLRGLTFIDSAGIGRVVAAHLRARRARRRFVLVRGPRAVQRILSLTALDTVFEMVTEPEGALA
jgi:anti-anti-sigma factor